MDVFLIWLFIIIAFLTVYTILLIKRSPKGFKLEVKLTIIFFMLFLIPSITLTLIVSGLLTQGVEMSFMPGIEASLTSSIQAIKHQLESRGERFINCIQDRSNIDQTKLLEHDVTFFGSYKINNKNIYESNNISIHDFPLVPLNYSLACQIFDSETSSTITEKDGQYYCQIYHPFPDSTIAIVGFTVDKQVISAKNRVSESLQVYTSLSLVKKSVLEGRLIWAMATLFIIILVLYFLRHLFLYRMY
jgi:hypothetical protein